MSDRPGPGERRRTGPLGDQGDAEKTRRETRREEPRDDGEETRRIPLKGFGEGRTGGDEAPTRRLRRSVGEDEGRTRAIRTPASGDTREASPYPKGYHETAEDREERLRDLYGGVDWLASFLGFVFAVVAGAFFSLVAGLVLGPLGFSLGGALDAAAITGLVVIGILVFLTWFFGGYVAGRLARFDGGLNGIVAVVWGLAAGVLLLAAGSFLPGLISGPTQGLVRGALLPAVGALREGGLVGIAIVAGVLLIVLLGGFLGGRAGGRYHSDIDGTI